MALSQTAKKWLIFAAIVIVAVILVCLYFAFVPAWCTIQVVIAFLVGIVAGVFGYWVARRWLKEGILPVMPKE